MQSVSMSDLTRVFGRIGLLSFGGPAAQIALMHKELVQDRTWLSEDGFLRALSFCMLLPGPEAMQLATYAGWRLQGVRGGLIAGGLFVLPGALVVLALAWIYALMGDVAFVQALFLGIKSVVVVVVIEALLKVSKRALLQPDRWIIAALAFLGIFALQVPFPLIILLAAIYGFLTAKSPATKPAPQVHVAKAATARTILVWLLLWLVPVAIAAQVVPAVLGQVALFFSKLAVVTFGGAYAVLAYMTQTVVGDFGWLTTPQMIDALGLAETTPGPLILVTEFVGFLAGYGQGGIALGLASAALTLWVTFVPCFLWIFAAAPYIELLAQKPRLSAALDAVTAAVVGVILNLSVWFAIHVFFAQIETVSIGPLSVIVPQLASLLSVPVGFALIAALLLIWRKWPLLWVLALAAGVGALGHLFGFFTI